VTPQSWSNGSKEAFVSLLEYAEDVLEVSHVVVCLAGKPFSLPLGFKADAAKAKVNNKVKVNKDKANNKVKVSNRVHHQWTAREPELASPTTQITSHSASRILRSTAPRRAWLIQNSAMLATVISDASQ